MSNSAYRKRCEGHRSKKSRWPRSTTAPLTDGIRAGFHLVRFVMSAVVGVVGGPGCG
jgi:hypothetical protein